MLGERSHGRRTLRLPRAPRLPVPAATRPTARTDPPTRRRTTPPARGWYQPSCHRRRRRPSPGHARLRVPRPAPILGRCARTQVRPGSLRTRGRAHPWVGASSWGCSAWPESAWSWEAASARRWRPSRNGTRPDSRASSRATAGSGTTRWCPPSTRPRRLQYQLTVEGLADRSRNAHVRGPRRAAPDDDHQGRPVRHRVARPGRDVVRGPALRPARATWTRPPPPAPSCSAPRTAPTPSP